MIYTHVLKNGPLGAISPLSRLRRKLAPDPTSCQTGTGRADFTSAASQCPPNALPHSAGRSAAPTARPGVMTGTPPLGPQHTTLRGGPGASAYAPTPKEVGATADKPSHGRCQRAPAESATIKIGIMLAEDKAETSTPSRRPWRRFLTAVILLLLRLLPHAGGQ
jgi:hypothetical protein